jgi:hypothetical protein
VEVGVNRCRSCQAEVVWVITERGRRMPLDAEPRYDGNVVIQVDAEGQEVGHYLRRGDVLKPGTPRYVSHFSTCPDAERHRRSA